MHNYALCNLYFLDSPWLSSLRSVKVAEGVGEHLDHPVGRRDHFELICLRKKYVKVKYVPCQFLINITGTRDGSA